MVIDLVAASTKNNTSPKNRYMFIVSSPGKKTGILIIPDKHTPLHQSTSPQTAINMVYLGVLGLHGDQNLLRSV